MKKFKEMLKSINKFGLALVVMAATLVITQSAFTESKKAPNYGKAADGSWVSLAGLTPYNLPGPIPSGMYRCDNEPTEICTAEFDHQPENNEVPTGTTTPGLFDYTP